jgi:hypothetical protein
MKRQRTEAEQKLADDARLLRLWKKWHRDELDEALAGPHGPMVERLMFILKELSRDSAALLTAYIRGVDWNAIDYPTKLTVLHEINTAITRLRERQGLAPINDPLPGERESVFRTLKQILLPASSGGHTGADAGPTIAIPQIQGHES